MSERELGIWRGMGSVGLDLISRSIGFRFSQEVIEVSCTVIQISCRVTYPGIPFINSQ